MPLFKKHNQENAAAVPTETDGRAMTTAQADNIQIPPKAGRQDHISHGGNQPITEDYPGYEREIDHQPEITGTGYGTRSAARASGTHGYESRGMYEPSMATTGMQQTTIPLAGTLNDENQTRGGRFQKMTGKMESAMGSMVGSEKLKAKGMQKEKEVNALKLQGRELAEAERLEQEALARRERAVAHGAHPANKNLGAGMRDDVRE